MKKLMPLIIGVTAISIFVFYQLWYVFFSVMPWFDSMNTLFPLFWIVFFIISIYVLMKKIPSLIVGCIGLLIFLSYQLWHFLLPSSLTWLNSMNASFPLFWIGIYLIITSALAAFFRSIHFEYSEKNYLTHPKGIMSWLLTLDHKRIGLMYLFGGIVFFFLGGVLALGMRLELAAPGNDFVSVSYTHLTLPTSYAV